MAWDCRGPAAPHTLPKGAAGTPRRPPEPPSAGLRASAASVQARSAGAPGGKALGPGRSWLQLPLRLSPCLSRHLPPGASARSGRSGCWEASLRLPPGGSGRSPLLSAAPAQRPLIPRAAGLAPRPPGLRERRTWQSPPPCCSRPPRGRLWVCAPHPCCPSTLVAAGSQLCHRFRPAPCPPSPSRRLFLGLPPPGCRAQPGLLPRVTSDPGQGQGSGCRGRGVTLGAGLPCYSGTSLGSVGSARPVPPGRSLGLRHLQPARPRGGCPVRFNATERLRSHLLSSAGLQCEPHSGSFLSRKWKGQ